MTDAQLAEIAAEEAKGFGLEIRTKSANYGNCYRVEIFDVDQASGDERVFFRTPEETKNLPILRPLSHSTARSQLRRFLRAAERRRTGIFLDMEP